MPATTAATAALSTGVTRRVSSREAAVSCRRHGISAAAAMQRNTVAARITDNSPSETTTDSASAAAIRMMVECRSRSDQGRAVGDDGASIAIGAGFSKGLLGSRLAPVRRRCRCAFSHKRL
ncbi:hypothetical protein ACVWW2_001405 [Bradyrhizobium sp. LM4.3]